MATTDAVRGEPADVQTVVTPLKDIPRATLGAPTLVIGSADGGPDQELYDVRTPWLSGGGIVLANSGTKEVRFYDERASLRRSVGRQGDGPGEYRMIAWVRPWRGDSLVVWDGFAGRLTILDRMGRTGRTLRLDADNGSRSRAGGTGGIRPVRQPEIASALDVLPGGQFLGEIGGASAVPGDTSALLRNTISLRVFDEEGRESARLVDVLDSESFRFVSGESRSVGPLPFGKSMAAAALEHPVDRAVVAVADNDSFEVRWLSLAGSVRLVGRVPLAAEPVTAALISAYKTQRKVDLGGLPPFAQQAQLELLEATPYPDSLPLHGKMIVDAGHVWLERYAPPGARVPGEWIAFDSTTGVATERLILPVDAKLASVRGDTAVVVETDELGVQRVKVAPIVGDS